MVLEARGGADLAGEVRNYSFSCMNIYFISIRLDSISTPLSSNHPNKSRHVLKKIGLETAKGGQFLLGPFYLFTTRCLILCCPPLPQAVSVSFTSTVPIHIAPPPCHQPVGRQLQFRMDVAELPRGQHGAEDRWERRGDEEESGYI